MKKSGSRKGFKEKKFKTETKINQSMHIQNKEFNEIKLEKNEQKKNILQKFLLWILPFKIFAKFFGLIIISFESIGIKSYCPIFCRFRFRIHSTSTCFFSC